MGTVLEGGGGGGGELDAGGGGQWSKTPRRDEISKVWNLLFRAFHFHELAHKNV